MRRWPERTRFDLAENRLAEVYRRARDHAGPGLVDLTVSNPTRVGLREAAALSPLLGEVDARRYEPEPFGLPRAREAVARHLVAQGQLADPARIVLTASSSEAYGWLFKLLGDPGDRVLVPRPSYPLFDYLARLEGLEVDRFSLLRAEAFRLDPSALEAAIQERTRAIVLVSPNNPTGTMLRHEELCAVAELAARHDLSLVVDEVFCDALLEPPEEPVRARLSDELPCLCFALGGLSKSLAAPQLKLGWTRVFGPASSVREALARLEVIADTYLSLATPVQLALPALLERAPRVRSELVQRLQGNLALVDELLSLHPEVPVRRLPVEGGWTVLLELPRIVDEDRWVELCAERAQALLAPGWFFDLDDGGTLVASLLVEPERFHAALGRVLALVEELCR